MLLQQLLNLALGIAACAEQVFFGVVEFVLIELELRLGDVDLVLEIFFRAVTRRRHLPGETRNLFLIGLDDGLRFGAAGHHLPLFRRRRRRMLGGLAHSRGEGEVDFIVGKPQGLVRQILFLRCRGQRRKFSSRLQGLLVNDGRGRLRCVL